MAKTKIDIAGAIRGEIKNPAVVASGANEADVVEAVPAENTEKVVAEPAGAPVKAPKKRGRPRKDDERDAFVRAAVSSSLKEKLHIICRQKNMTESDYTYELLKKAVNKDFEQAFSAMSDDFE